MSLCATFKTASRGHISSAPIVTTKPWWLGLSGSSRRRGSRLDLPLDVRGTAFQRRVWQALQEIPVGATVSYTEIARRIGAPRAARAVAGACAANHLAVAIPCDRVVRNDGSLFGYAWGVERKRDLLDREKLHRTRELAIAPQPLPNEITTHSWVLR
jgi:O-6-methylguanine DNA methyltransferase